MLKQQSHISGQTNLAQNQIHPQFKPHVLIIDAMTLHH